MLLTFSLPELAERVISPSNIRTISSTQVMRITKYQLEDTMIQNQILLGGKGLIQVLQNRGKRKNDKKTHYMLYLTSYCTKTCSKILLKLISGEKHGLNFI